MMSFSITAIPYMNWFCYKELLFETNLKISYKIDFELLWKDYGSNKSDNNKVYLEDIKIINEHTNQQYFTKKLIKLIKYVQHIFLY